MTNHRLRCSASPQYQSRDLFVRKIPLPHRYNQIAPFLCAPLNLYFLHFHHIIPHFYFYSNIPIHIVESDTNITHSYKSWCWGSKVFCPLWYQIATCFALSQSSKAFVIRSFFFEKRLLTHVFGGSRGQKSSCKQACIGFLTFWPWYQIIILLQKHYHFLL